MTTHRLRDVALVLTSNVDKVIDPDEHPVRLCNYVDVYKNKFIHNDMLFKPGSATAAEIKKFRVHVDDVIITKDSETADDIGVPALVKSTADDLVCGYHLSILRADRRRLIGPFLYWHLLSKKSQEDFGNAANGVTRYGLTQGGIKSIPINVPDLATQRQIADFLDRETARIDLLIEKKQRLVALLGEKVSAFRETHIADGKPTRVKFISNYITSGSRDWGGLYSDEGELFVRIGNVSGTGIDLDLRKKTFVELGDRTEGLRTRLRMGDLLVSITADLGSVAVVGKEAQGAYINQHLALVRLRQSVVDQRYVAHAMITRAVSDQFALRGYGGTKQGLSLKDVAEIAIPLPPKEAQVRIARQVDLYVSQQSAANERINASIDRLKEYRSALITAAVTGQIDVQTYANSGTTDRRLDEIQEEMQA